MFQKIYIKIQNLREDDQIYEEIRFLKCVAYFSVVSAFACVLDFIFARVLRRRLFPFRKRPLPLSTVHAIIGNQVFSMQM